MKILVLLFMVIFLVSLSSCSDDSASGSGFMYSNAKLVAPIINVPATRENQRTTSLPGLLDSIYSLIKNYDKDLPHDGQGVNMENIFRVFAAADGWYDQSSSCSAITAQAITAPFPVFATPNQYNCVVNNKSDESVAATATITDVGYANGMAFDTSDANIKKALFGYRWSPGFNTDGHLEHGVVEGSLNETTKDLSLRNIHLVNYNSATSTPAYSGFVVRTHVTGNTTTHLFTFSTINSAVHRAGNVVGGNWQYNATTGYTAIVGKGYSKLDSASDTAKYILFKGISTNRAAVYYCLEVGVNGLEYTDLLEIDANGTGTPTEGTNCWDYKEAVDTLYTDELLGPTDLPYSLEGVTGVDPGFGGTILLNYN